MREFLTNLAVGAGAVAFVGAVIGALAGIGSIAVDLLAEPGMPPPDFDTRISVGIAMLLVVGFLWGIGKWIRELRAA